GMFILGLKFMMVRMIKGDIYNSRVIKGLSMCLYFFIDTFYNM
ncbi:MAG: hypothetical protein K0Q56_2689, partial [Sporolactobacillus laevolacticus]|nr:hypothetical protein [Sporolactobacillus laevolacticus]